MNIVVLERQHERTFNLLTDAPKWLEHFCGPQLMIGHPLDLNGTFPFLDCFIEEAEEFWATKVSSPQRSGAWIEFSPSGEEIPLEATALWQNGQCLLIIQDLGEEYYNEVVRLQSFRDHSLTQESLQAEVETQTKAIRAREEAIAMTLLTAAGHRDHETAAHVRRIGLYAEVMAKSLKWATSEIADIRIAAPMHDIGKIGIPDRILLKPGKLDENEFEIMKTHAAIGADMLSGTDIPLLKMASDIALCHHERWDGSGYPRGLAGKDIPESARIVTIVDVYDALVHKRVYKEASSEQSALKLMSQMVGKHFDPELFKIFLSNLPTLNSIRMTHVEPVRP